MKLMLRIGVLTSLAIGAIAAGLLMSTLPKADTAEAAVNQTIAFPSILTKTFGAAPFLINPTASSGLPVSVVSTTPAQCTLTGDGLSAGGNTEQVNIVGAGPCSISATQAGDVNWNPATPVVRSFTIRKASQSIAFAAISNKVFGYAPFTADATASSGLPVTLAVWGSAGACSVAPVDADTWTVTLLAAGTCSLQATQAGNANYNAAFSVLRSFTVAKAAVTVTADSMSRPYNSANPTLTADITGLVTGPVPDVASGSPVAGLSGTLTCTTAAGTLSSAGAYLIWCGGLASTNYTVSYVNAVLTITKINQTITFAMADKTYGDPSFTVSATSDSGPFVTLSASGPCTVPAGSFFGPVTITGVGLCTITANQAGNNNYNAADPTPRSFTINPATTLTITAQGKTISVGQALPVFTVTYSGFKYFDNQNTPGLFSAPVTCGAFLGDGVTPMPDTLTAGSYRIICSGEAVNYEPETFVEGVLTINP